ALRRDGIGRARALVESVRRVLEERAAGRRHRGRRCAGRGRRRGGREPLASVHEPDALTLILEPELHPAAVLAIVLSLWLPLGRGRPSPEPPRDEGHRRDRTE